jgi:hypothetical protein
MNFVTFVKLLVVLIVAALGYQYWNKHHAAGASTEAGGSRAGTSAVASRGDFVELPPVSGASAKAVLIIAAQDCPEEAAQRADRLAEQLGRQGVPVSRLQDVHFDIANGDAAIARKLTSVMNSPLPIVFVHGRAKSNPTLDEVVAEYRSGG